MFWFHNPSERDWDEVCERQTAHRTVKEKTGLGESSEGKGAEFGEFSILLTNTVAITGPFKHQNIIINDRHDNNHNHNNKRNKKGDSGMENTGTTALIRPPFHSTDAKPGLISCGSGCSVITLSCTMRMEDGMRLTRSTVALQRRPLLIRRCGKHFSMYSTVLLLALWIHVLYVSVL